MQTLRQFRDTYLKEQEDGPELIATYYADAPNIVEAIDRSEDRDKIYQDIYEKILQLVEFIDDQKYDQAVIEYMLMVYKFRNIL